MSYFVTKYDMKYVVVVRRCVGPFIIQGTPIYVLVWKPWQAPLDSDESLRQLVLLVTLLHCRGGSTYLHLPTY